MNFVFVERPDLHAEVGPGAELGFGVQSRNGVGTSDLLVTLFADGSPEDLGRCATLGSIALARSLQAVELDEGSKRGLELVPPSEAASAKDNPHAYPFRTALATHNADINKTNQHAKHAVFTRAIVRT